MVKKSAQSPKVKPAKKKAAKKTAAKKTATPVKGESHVNELRSAAKASAGRRLKK